MEAALPPGAYNPYAHVPTPAAATQLDARPARVNEVQQWQGCGVVPGMELAGAAFGDAQPGYYTGEYRDASCDNGGDAAGASGQQQLCVTTQRDVQHRFYLDPDGDYNHPVSAPPPHASHSTLRKSLRAPRRLQQYTRIDFTGKTTTTANDYSRFGVGLSATTPLTRATRRRTIKRIGVVGDGGDDAHVHARHNGGGGVVYGGATGDAASFGNGDVHLVGAPRRRQARKCPACACVRECAAEVRSIVRRCTRDMIRFSDAEFDLNRNLYECVYGEDNAITNGGGRGGGGGTGGAPRAYRRPSPSLCLPAHSRRIRCV
jgi:hypothetical protein